MKTAKITASVIALSMLAACTQPNGQPNRGVMSGGGINKQDVGTVGGGVLGAVVGSSFGKGNGRVVGGVIGAGLGALLGNQIGASLDNADRAAASQTAYNTFETNPTGRPGTWRNPDSGNYGTYTPTKTYQAPGGEYCREFTQTIVVGGKKQEGYGTACRQPDGTWAIQN